MQTLRRRAALERFNPNHAPAGSPEGGQFTSDGDGDGGGSSKPSGGDKGKAKVSKVVDFNKKGIRLDHDPVTNPAKAENSCSAGMIGSPKHRRISKRIFSVASKPR
jgi:hypothetical protein